MCCTVAGGRTWQESRDIAGTATSEQGPQRTVAARAAIPPQPFSGAEEIRDYPKLPKLGPDGPEPVRCPAPGRGLLVSQPAAVPQGSSAVYRLVPPR